jgi:phosphatidylcholine synthase
MSKPLNPPLTRRTGALTVHLFTALGGVVGLFTLLAIYHHNFILAFYLMGAAMFIDSVDGLLARWARTKINAPKIDGALMDMILDYLNYVIVPAFLLVVAGLLPGYWEIVAAAAIVLASAFQFANVEAKTADHFFTGFPSYWNVVVFYIFLWQLPAVVNAGVIFLGVILVFVPIKYIYLSRVDYLAHSKWLRTLMVLAAVLWGVTALWLLWIYPNSNRFWVIYSIAFFVAYILISIYRTFVPLQVERVAE